MPQRTQPLQPRAQQIRFTYQRLADHVRADALLARSTDERDLVGVVSRLLTGTRMWSRMGLLEALALVTPEQRGTELIDLVDAAEVPVDQSLRERLVHHLLGTLAWRTPSSISPRTIELATSIADSDGDPDGRWLDLRISLACVPGHPLNVDHLDQELRPTSLSERDATWSLDLVWLWSQDSSSLHRLIDWAWSSRVDTADREVVELAGRLLAWVFASSDRYLRDSATKAMLRLADSHTDILAQLLASFAPVNDPYIVERLLAVAYGHLLRRRHDDLVRPDLDAAEVIVAVATETILNPADSPGHEHLLIRYYARGCAAVASTILLRHGRSAAVDPNPSATTTWPITAPTLDELAAAYGREPSKYLFAVTELGSDFEDKVIKSACEDFVLPDQQAFLAQRQERDDRERARLRSELLHAVAGEQRDEIVSILDQLLADTAAGRNPRKAWKTLQTRLVGEATTLGRELESLAWRSRASQRTPVRPDPDLVGRWIAQCVLDLGWSKNMFGDIDRNLAELRSYNGEAIERIGKKYAWIAFYQALGRLTDHCQIQDLFDKRPEPYCGPWQISRGMDIDPSVSLRGDDSLRNPLLTPLPLQQDYELNPPWWRKPYQHRLVETGDQQTWLADRSDIPDHLDLLTATDPHGAEWVAVETHVTWQVHRPSLLRRRPRREQWMRSHAYLIDQADLPRVRRWAAQQNWMGLWMPTPSDYPRGLLGEYPDLAPWPEQLAVVAAEASGVHRNARNAFARSSWLDLDTHGIRCSMALTTAYYRKLSDRDHSAKQLPPCIAPSPMLLELLGASWAPTRHHDPADRLGPVEREYSWYADEQLVAFATTEDTYGRPQTLWVRAGPLRHSLNQHGLALWAWTLGEKTCWDETQNKIDGTTEIYGAIQLHTQPPSTWNLRLTQPDRTPDTEYPTTSSTT